MVRELSKKNHVPRSNWLPDAITDLMRLRKFIQDKNPSAAKRAASKIKEGALTLMSNPESGRPVESLSSFR